MTKKIKKTLNIVLKTDIKNLGKKNQIKNVRNGYALNFLFPKKKASFVTKEILEQIKLKEQEEIVFQEKRKIENLNLKKKLENFDNFVLKKRLRDNQYIFGKITKKQILDLISQSFDFEEKNVQIENLPDIKEKGIYKINLILYPEIIATIELQITPE